MARSQDQETVGSTLPDAAPPGDEPRPTLATFREPAERFEHGDEIGRGGMGRVIAAADVSLRREVAIKQVLSADHHDLIRFEREVRITAQLEHPSIVPIYDVGIDAEDRPFYVMRRIDGVPLTDRLDGDTRARLALLPNVLAAIDAAAFAHARKIIHRDIKPSNILLGAYGETWLIDWGLARRLDEPDEVVEAPDAASSLPGDQLTIAGHVYGTAAYMPPEQARGEAVDARADVYALGATLFHVLSGRGPFHGVSAAQRIARAIEGESAPARLPDDTAPELRAIVDKAMSTAPGDRYADARELAADLRAHLAGQLVGAHRYTARERFVRFVRRHRLALAIAVLSITAMAIAAAISISQVLEERDKATEAEASSAHRANLTLLEHASAMAEIDPARAIGLLRELPHTDTYFERARDIAAKAAARGIPHGSIGHRTTVSALAFSPDHTWIASADISGAISLHTVASGMRYQVAKVEDDVHELLWVDGGTKLVAMMRRHGISVITIATGTHVTYRFDAKPGWVMLDPRGDRVDFIDEKERLWEFDIATGARRLLFGDTHAAVQHGDRWLLASPTGGLRMAIGDRVQSLAEVGPGVNRSLAVNASGTRFAAVVGRPGNSEVAEWDRDGNPLRRWPLRFANQLTYHGDTLYAATLDGALQKIDPTPYELLRTRERINQLVTTPLGLAVITSDAHFHLVDFGGIRELVLRSVEPHAIEVDAAAGLVAVGTAAGEVRWWNYGAMLPTLHEVHSYIPCQVDRDKLYFFEATTLYELDLATHHKRQIADSETFAFSRCVGHASPDKLVYVGPAGVGVIDVRTRKQLVLHHADAICLGDDHTVFAASGAKLVELPNGSPPGIERFVAPRPIIALVASPAWVTMQLDDGSMLRLDRATWTPVQIKLPKITRFVISPDGATWLASEHELYRWADLVTLYAVMEPGINSFNVDGNTPIVKLNDRTMWRARTGTGFRRVEVGSPLDVMRQEIVVGRNGPLLVVVRVRTGEQITYSLPSPVVSMSVGESSHVLFATVSGEYLIQLTDPVPDLPMLGWAWIDSATNAIVNVETDELTWR